MFESTTLRLTGWYLLILMTVSIVFSLVVFQVASSEVENRLERFQNNLQISPNFIPPIGTAASLRHEEVNKAAANISIELLYINLIVLIAGGLGSYFLARHSLKPIEKAHEAQSRFTSDASHELRTPLAVMKTELEVAIRDKNASVDDLKQILVSNIEEVDKLSRLSEMLLNMSQMDNAKLKLAPINIDKILRSTIKTFIKDSNRFDIDSEENLVAIGNEMAITDLIKIFADNALQYSPTDSKIKISLAKNNGQVRFGITNSGHGISPEKLEHIFDRFYRADESRTGGKRKSFGLGLALAKTIIDLHNSQIDVTSGIDEDTTFTFYLPLNHNVQAKVKN